jgi:hypothetical protein
MVGSSECGCGVQFRKYLKVLNIPPILGSLQIVDIQEPGNATRIRG